MKINSPYSSQYGSDFGTEIEALTEQNEVLNCRTEALNEKATAERVSLSTINF